MRLAILAAFLLLVFAPAASAQADVAPRIASIAPYPNVVPGQIIELRVEGLGETFNALPGDALSIILTQDGATKTARARTASSMLMRETPSGADGAGDLKAFQSLSFVVPRGVHAGEAEVAVSFRGRRSAPFKLNVVERPLRPVVGGTAIRTIAPASLPAPVRSRTPLTREQFGLRFERGAKGVELHVRPLADPEDPEAGVAVRFKQGDAFYDANARVVHRKGGREDLANGGFRLSPARDVLEVDVPELLAPGEAELEVTLRAAGQTGEAALVPVTVTDAERAFESPKEAAPRLLAVSPRRVGAGQALLISVDRRRALDPDPSKARVVFEAQDGTRQMVEPEMNSALREPSASPDLPVLFIVRAPQLTGSVRIKLLNPAREEYAGAEREPVEVEISSEPIAPEVTAAAEASESEIAQLQKLSAAQTRDPRVRPVYESSARYVSIRGTGFDPNPQFLRVRFEQEGRASVTLGRGDFALYSQSGVIVRLPKNFRPGTLRVSVENHGANGFSAPSVTTFELSPRP